VDCAVFAGLFWVDRQGKSQENKRKAEFSKKEERELNPLLHCIQML